MKAPFSLFCALGLIACSAGQDDVGQGAPSGAGGDAASSGGSAQVEGAGGASGGADAAGGSIVEPGSGGDLGSGGIVETGGSPSGGTAGDLGTGGDVGSGGGDVAGSGGGEGDGCPHAGSVTYSLNNPGAWPEEVVAKITEAMDSALYYYNCYSDLQKHITVNYDSGVPTAQANVDGWLSFGADQSYMQTATAMHEVAHTLGVGYYPWTELIVGGRWSGAAVEALLSSIPSQERDQDEYSLRDYITCDSQHFWPYGLNQASEYQSEWSVINHVRIVAAINEDKEAYLNP